MLFDRIELFVNVAKHQNLTKTAREMHVSPSSVSQRLKSLEKDFGVKLYRRNKDGIELTPEGGILLDTASRLVYQLQALRETLNPKSSKTVQRLVVGGSYNPSAKHLPAALALFQKNHPDIQVTFLTSRGSRVQKWLRNACPSGWRMGIHRCSRVPQPVSPLLTAFSGLDPERKSR